MRRSEVCDDRQRHRRPGCGRGPRPAPRLLSGVETLVRAAGGPPGPRPARRARHRHLRVRLPGLAARRRRPGARPPGRPPRRPPHRPPARAQRGARRRRGVGVADGRRRPLRGRRRRRRRLVRQGPGPRPLAATCSSTPTCMGTGPGGGAVLFVGDDPSAKSSTLPYDTNLALADAGVPVLVPADQQDLFDLGVEAFRLSRFCGSWVGVRIVTAVADGIGAVDTGDRPVPRRRPRGRGRRRAVAARAGRPRDPRPATSRSCGSTAASAPRRGGWRPAASTACVGARSGRGPARHRLRRQDLPRRARGARGLRRGADDLADAGVRILKLAMTYPLVPGPRRSSWRSVGRRDPRGRGEAAVRRAAGAGDPPRGGQRPTPVRGKRDGDRRGRWCRWPAS